MCLQAPGLRRGPRWRSHELLALRESPAQREEPAKLRPRGGIIRDVARRDREIEAAAYLGGLAMGDLILEPLVTATMGFALAQVLDGAVHRVDQLLGEVVVVLADLLDEGTQIANQLEGDLGGNQHVVFSCG